MKSEQISFIVGSIGLLGGIAVTGFFYSEILAGFMGICLMSLLFSIGKKIVRRDNKIKTLELNE